MPFDYSCFISYRHPQHDDDLTKTFIKDLKKALKTYISPWMDQDIYIDEDRLKPGYHFNEALSDAICRSVCLILIYTPRYFRKDSTYCTREYWAMKKLEQERRKMLPRAEMGFIIPIVFRGPKLIPAELKNEIHYCDFSKYTLAQTEISKNPEYIEKIDNIAEYIHELHEHIKNVNPDCSRFRLPSDKDVEDWLRKIDPSMSNPQSLV
jgi:hypothetical protein